MNERNDWKAVTSQTKNLQKYTNLFITYYCK